jgi:SagB-type dehydrogenase family enzyme
MKRSFFASPVAQALALAFVLILAVAFGATAQSASVPGQPGGESIKLPPPRLDGTMSVEKALQERRSIRAYKEEPLTLQEVSQILWAAQGITEPKKGLRAAPSAKAGYFLKTYLFAGNVTGLPMGMYRYEPKGHELVKIAEGDKKGDLFKAAPQAPIKAAAAALLFTGDLERSANNTAYSYYEAGHVSQNVYLQATSLGIGTVAMAGWKADEVRKAFGFSEKELPVYIMPLGKK